MVTGEEPLRRVALPDHAQDGLQQSQYRVVVPDPDAARARRKKGRRASRVLVGRSILKLGVGVLGDVK